MDNKTPLLTIKYPGKNIGIAICTNSDNDGIANTLTIKYWYWQYLRSLPVLLIPHPGTFYLLLKGVHQYLCVEDGNPVLKNYYFLQTGFKRCNQNNQTESKFPTSKQSKETHWSQNSLL